MKKKTGGGSDSTAYHKKKFEGSMKILNSRDTTTPVGKQAFSSAKKGMEGLARAENKKAGVPNPPAPKKDFSKGSPYNTKSSSMSVKPKK